MDSLFCHQSGKNDMNTLYHLQNVPLVLIPLLVLRNKIWVFTQRSTTIVSAEIYSRKHKNRRSIFEQQQQQQQLRPNLSGGINCFFSLIGTSITLPVTQVSVQILIGLVASALRWNSRVRNTIKILLSPL